MEEFVEILTKLMTDIQFLTAVTTNFSKRQILMDTSLHTTFTPFIITSYLKL